MPLFHQWAHLAWQVDKIIKVFFSLAGLFFPYDILIYESQADIQCASVQGWLIYASMSFCWSVVSSAEETYNAVMVGRQRHISSLFCIKYLWSLCLIGSYVWGRPCLHRKLWLELRFSYNNPQVLGAALSTHATYFCSNSSLKISFWAHKYL